MSFYEILPSKTIDFCQVAGTLATRKFWFMETLPRGLIPETIPYANHGAGIFTYKTGWFCSGKCWDSYSSTMEHMGKGSAVDTLEHAKKPSAVHHDRWFDHQDFVIQVDEPSVQTPWEISRNTGWWFGTSFFWLSIQLGWWQLTSSYCSEG